MKKLILAVITAAALASALSAKAAVYTVDAYANSSSGGSPAPTISLTAGQSFNVSVNPNDLWNAGALPRWSNANGLVANLNATGSDESGQLAGTLIGKPFGSYTQGNLSAPYGALVGQIGAGPYFLIGTSFSGTAAATGTLKLLYWDSNKGDNTEHISAAVSAVPEPSTYFAGMSALGMLCLFGRRNRK
jgi:hypothetical protein